MATETEAHLDWFQFLEARLQTAVQAAVAAGSDPDDALRGLYISDEQALALAAEGGRPRPSSPLGEAATRLAETAQRLGLDALDSSVLALCAAPELHPRFGRLYAYLQDDVTRRLASPRLAADLLASEWVGRPRRARVLRSDALRCRGGARSACRRRIRPPRSPIARSRSRTGWPRSCSAPATSPRLPPESGCGAAIRSRSAVAMSPYNASRCCSRRARASRWSCAARMAARSWRPPPALRSCSSAYGSSTVRRRSPTPASPPRSHKGCCVSTGSRTSRRPSARSCCGRSTKARSGSCCWRPVAATQSR